MRKTGFLAKLHGEGKLDLTEPSEEIEGAYIKKSESYLVSAKLLLDNNRLEESISMTYYSMYYLLQALLYRTGIKCENHSATITLLKELYSIDNSEITAAKKERIDKQYYVDFSITRQEAATLIKVAEAFNAKTLDFLKKLNNEGIRYYREKLKKLMGNK